MAGSDERARVICARFCYAGVRYERSILTGQSSEMIKSSRSAESDSVARYDATVPAIHPFSEPADQALDAGGREAFVGLTADAERWGRQQKPAGVAQHRHFFIQGADYSL